jgi:hypothetical protein
MAEYAQPGDASAASHVAAESDPRFCRLAVAGFRYFSAIGPARCDDERSRLTVAESVRGRPLSE